MLDQLQVISHPLQHTAVVHLHIPREEIVTAMGPALDEVLSTLAAQGKQPEGPCFSKHLQAPDTHFDFEIGFPVAEPIAPAGRVRPSTLPALQVARCHYHGPYEGLGEAWGGFCAAISAQGLQAGLPLWEVYLEVPDGDSNQCCTQLNRVLEETHNA